MSISETSGNQGTPAIRGENTGGGTGVYGISASGRGVEGWSTDNYGVTGDSQKFPGVRGTSVRGRGIEGWSSENDGVWGFHTGNNKDAAGVHGVSEEQGMGVFGNSGKNDGVRGVSRDGNGVSAFGGHTGIFAKGPINAGFFEGSIHVTGDITTAGDIKLFNADCAEDFDIACLEQVEPGTVMVIDSEGALKLSDRAYDKRVAGVISGAGNYKPGLILDKQESSNNRMPVALMGKVYCKVDASYGAIEVGDLLTTSPTPGYAMKADEPLKAFGTVIGKALRPLVEGQGLIPILVALQ